MRFTLSDLNIFEYNLIALTFEKMCGLLQRKDKQSGWQGLSLQHGMGSKIESEKRVFIIL